MGCEARQRHVRLDTAALIEPLRVDRAADRHVDVVGGHEVQRLDGVRPADQKLAVTGLVDEQRRVARRQALPLDLRKPRLQAEARLIGNRGARPVVIQRDLPSDALPHDRAGGEQAIVHGQVPHLARR